jgi:23S rRNA (uracil1939-C5)-methyltransferase
MKNPVQSAEKGGPLSEGRPTAEIGSAPGRTAPSAPSTLATIDKPLYGGACLARIEGRAVFVPLTLPGEQARIRIKQSKSGYAEAEVEEIVVAAPQRVAPACPHFGICGGCHYQHAEYDAQLEMKKTILRETLERAGVDAPAEIEVLSAEPWGYRNRIRLALDAAGNPGYRERRSHAVLPIRACPIAAPLLVEAALAFSELVRTTATALKASEIALFTNHAQDSLLLTVFTTSARKHRFEALMEALRERIPALSGAELAVEDRKAGQPRTVARWGASWLTYRAAGCDYRVDHGAFFQTNRRLVDTLVERVVAGHRGELAWDLFAGVGLFARQLTAHFHRVLAVESAPASMQALAANLKGTRGIPVRSLTLDFLRIHNPASRAEFVAPELIVADPPRTGLGAETCALLGEIAAPALVYVSCDPATLARDLRQLLGTGYAIESIALADLFPQTFHLETVAVLQRT